MTISLLQQRPGLATGRSTPPNERRVALIAGLLFVLTFITAIAAVRSSS